jgi:hypothetical protein
MSSFFLGQHRLIFEVRNDDFLRLEMANFVDFVDKNLTNFVFGE